MVKLFCACDYSGSMTIRQKGQIFNTLAFSSPHEKERIFDKRIFSPYEMGKYSKV